jgi:hypothetical protein
LQPSRRTFFHVQRHTSPPEQRRGPHYRPNHQGSHVLASQGRDWSPLHQLLGSSPCSPNLRILGASSIQTDNTTALDVVNNIVMKKLKAMDMKYHWLWDRISQKQFRHYWAPGNKNKGDYVTNHHAPVHHEAMRLTFLTSIATLQALHNRVSNLLPAARVC